MQQNVELRLELGGGAEPPSARVQVFRVTDDAPEPVAQVDVTAGAGSCVIEGELGEGFYAVASGIGSGDEDLLATFTLTADPNGASVTLAVSLDPRSTVANVYSFLQFVGFDQAGALQLSDPTDAWRIASAMRGNFISTCGELSDVISLSPNGLETNGYALWNSLGNLVRGALLDAALHDALLDVTGARTVVGAIAVIAGNPAQSVAEIYQLVERSPTVFSPSLPELEPPATPQPDQWTLTVKRNDSGAENFLIAGVGNVAFDKNDRLWLSNNFRQGTGNSGTFCVVLEPDGSPAPFSPVFGGGILGAGFGAAASLDGERIYIGNYGWGPAEQNPHPGSVSAFTPDGRALSPSNGWVDGLSRVQGMACDAEGNLWMSSWGSQDPMPPTRSRFNWQGENSSLVVYLGGDPKRVVSHEFDSPYHLTFDVAIDAEGHGYVVNAGDAGHGVKSSITKFALRDDELVELANWQSDWVNPNDPGKVGFETLRQVAVAPNGDVYAVGVVSSRVLHFDSDLNDLGEFTNQIQGPWGITVDAEGTLFVANFSREMESTDVVDIEIEADRVVVRQGDGVGPYGVTVIRDGDESTAHLMTVPTGGAEVRLANGLPLYGNPVTRTGKPLRLRSYDPIMRLTATVIDRAGNLWACNNWKPSAFVDAVVANPGGDGMVVYVGMAARPGVA